MSDNGDLPINHPLHPGVTIHGPGLIGTYRIPIEREPNRYSQPLPQMQPFRLSDEDVERIARRVAELLRPRVLPRQESPAVSLIDDLDAAGLGPEEPAAEGVPDCNLGILVTFFLETDGAGPFAASSAGRWLAAAPGRPAELAAYMRLCADRIEAGEWSAQPGLPVEVSPGSFAAGRHLKSVP